MGNAYPVMLAVMDAMGGTQRQTRGVGTRTSEVYQFCTRFPGRILPAKGEQRLAQPVRYTTPLKFYPGTQVPIPGGLRLFNTDVTFFKNELAGKLKIAPADPGAWHLHAETTADWTRQLTAEYLDEFGLWQCPAGVANHGWDVSVYNLAAAYFLDISQWTRPEPATGQNQSDKAALPIVARSKMLIS